MFKPKRYRQNDRTSGGIISRFWQKSDFDFVFTSQIHVFGAPTLFSILTAKRFNSLYMKYVHILFVSDRQTLALAGSAGPPSPPIHASIGHY